MRAKRLLAMELAQDPRDVRLMRNKHLRMQVQHPDQLGGSGTLVANDKEWTCQRFLVLYRNLNAKCKRSNSETPSGQGTAFWLEGQARGFDTAVKSPAIGAFAAKSRQSSVR